MLLSRAAWELGSGPHPQGTVAALHISLRNLFCVPRPVPAGASPAPSYWLRPIWMSTWLGCWPVAAKDDEVLDVARNNTSDVREASHVPLSNEQTTGSGNDASPSDVGSTVSKLLPPSPSAGDGSPFDSSAGSPITVIRVGVGQQSLLSQHKVQ